MDSHPFLGLTRNEMIVMIVVVAGAFVALLVLLLALLWRLQKTAPSVSSAQSNIVARGSSSSKNGWTTSDDHVATPSDTIIEVPAVAQMHYRSGVLPCIYVDKCCMDMIRCPADSAMRQNICSHMIYIHPTSKSR